MTMNITCVMVSLNFQLTFSSQTVPILNAICLCYKRVYNIEKVGGNTRFISSVEHDISRVGAANE